MSKGDLPWELERTRLTFAELIATLKAIDGEPVVVTLRPREPGHGPVGGLASIVGELRYEETARYDGYEISIGDPYAERYPENLAGGILFLDAASVEDASLRTFDGNDYFSISITTRSAEILIGDTDSQTP